MLFCSCGFFTPSPQRSVSPLSRLLCFFVGLSNTLSAKAKFSIFAKHDWTRWNEKMLHFVTDDGWWSQMCSRWRCTTGFWQREQLHSAFQPSSGTWAVVKPTVRFSDPSCRLGQAESGAHVIAGWLSVLHSVCLFVRPSVWLCCSAVAFPMTRRLFQAKLQLLALLCPTRLTSCFLALSSTGGSIKGGSDIAGVKQVVGGEKHYRYYDY